MPQVISQRAKDKLNQVDVDVSIPATLKLLFKEQILRQMVQRNETLVEDVP